LQIDGTLNGIDGTRELYEDAIASNLKDAAVVFRNERLQYFVTAGLQYFQCACLVLLHETAVSNDIGGQYGGETAMSGFFPHKPGPFTRATRQIV
jgi:hypothetical protein